MWKTKGKTQVRRNQEDNWKPYLLLINSTLDVMGDLHEQLELSGWLRTSRSWGRPGRTWTCWGSGHQLRPTRSISDTTRQPPVPTTFHQPSESKNYGCCWSTSSSGVTQSLISTESSDTYLRLAFVSVTRHSTEEHRREQKILATSHEEGCFLQHLFPLCFCLYLYNCTWSPCTNKIRLPVILRPKVGKSLVEFVFQAAPWGSTLESVLESHGSLRDLHPPPQLTPKSTCSPKALPAFFFSSCGPSLFLWGEWHQWLNKFKATTEVFFSSPLPPAGSTQPAWL